MKDDPGTSLSLNSTYFWVLPLQVSGSSFSINCLIMQGCSLHQTKASVSMHKIHVYYPCVLWNCIYMQNLLQFQPTFTQHQHNIGPAEEPSSASVVLSIQWSILWDTDAIAPRTCNIWLDAQTNMFATQHRSMYNKTDVHLPQDSTPCFYMVPGN